MSLRLNRALFYSAVKTRVVHLPPGTEDSYATEAGDDINTEADDALILE